MMKKKNLLAHFKNDFLTALVFFGVALPPFLCISLGPHPPVLSAIKTGLVVSIAVGLCSCSSLSMIIPAVALTVKTVDVKVQTTGYKTMVMTVVQKGVLQVILEK